MTASVEIIAEIDRLDPAAWDSLVPRNYPFLKHAFLSAMENRGCLGEWSGWVPRWISRPAISLAWKLRAKSPPGWR